MVLRKNFEKFEKYENMDLRKSIVRVSYNFILFLLLLLLLFYYFIILLLLLLNHTIVINILV